MHDMEPEVSVSLRILLVEDNEINRRVAKLLLTKLGHVVEIACNGEEAVHACHKRVYDVILMDSHMPVMTGIEATLEIRKLAGPQPAIIALTADAISGRREYYLSNGMDAYLTKPYTMDQLVMVIEAAILKAQERLTETSNNRARDAAAK
jgi:CheY-like chemotaxis protein